MNVKTYTRRFLIFLRKDNNRSVLVFLIFLLLASVLWFLNTLNRRYTITVPVKVNYVNLPNHKALVSQMPDTVYVQVSGVGFFLLPYYYSPPIYNLYVDDYSDFLEESIEQVNVEMKDLFQPTIFHQRIKVLQIVPQNILFEFSHIDSKRVPVVSNFLYSFQQQFQFAQPIELIPDSVTIYGAYDIIQHIDSVATMPIQKVKLAESFSSQVALETFKNVNVSDSVVQMNVFVEKFTEQIFNVPITALHVPDSMIIDLMHYKVQVSVFVGITKTKNISVTDFYAVADYSKQDLQTGEIPIVITKKPQFVKIVKQVPVRTGFIIESK